MNYSQNINSCFVCLRQAQSTSLEFTSLLDDGLNYCNLYDLLTGERALTGTNTIALSVRKHPFFPPCGHIMCANKTMNLTFDF